jgi:prolyl-tRNA synthetase
MHFKTLREVPAEAEIPSHIWLLRGGMIRKLASGIYGFMHMGFRSYRKIEEIVRQEMDAKGAQEIHMSAINPAELWMESGRWHAMGPELWRLKDRHGRDFCLGPTHEEVFTDIVRSEVSSYRQLPLNLYHIQIKYRDEARPRFGLMRSREFVMKDAYSFDRDYEGLDRSYALMYDAYIRVFSRCGLSCNVVEADSGAIGGKVSHEFIVPADVGESEIAHCASCGMAATTDRAATRDDPPQDGPELETEEILTPGIKTIDDLVSFVGFSPKKTIKALLLAVYGEDNEIKEYVAAFIRGDRELNMTKLTNALGVPPHMAEFADEALMGPETGCVGGFTGPVGLRNCRFVVDSELPGCKNMLAGACKTDYHMLNVNYGRDYKADILTDIKMIREGDPCPVCGAPVSLSRGMELGHLFKLGTKYSDSMGAYYKDEKMQDIPIVMGCYGIGVTRTLAAVVEMYHDDDGIIWPVSVAPYHVMVTVVKAGDAEQAELGERIYGQLLDEGIEVLLDDRDERPGVKFKDADMIGLPVRITVGKKAAQGLVEYRLRREQGFSEMGAAEAVAKAAALIRAEIRGSAPG